MKTYEDLLKDTENTLDCPDDKNVPWLDTKYVGGEKVEHYIVWGNEKVVFIKAGAGGSARGFQDKYIKMAERIHGRIGATVICASNPDVTHEEQDEKEIRWVIGERGFVDFELYFVGVSDGAYKNFSLVKKFPQTVKLLGINSSYITVAGLIEELKSLPNIEKILICGTKDIDSMAYVEPIQKAAIPKLKIQLVEGADHNFIGMLDEFISLSEIL